MSKVDPQDGVSSTEASIRKFVTTYFRVARLGSPKYFLATLKHNHMFQIPHDPMYLGWIAFGHLRSHFLTSTEIPAYVEYFAPYLAKACFYIARYVKSLGQKQRQIYRPFLDEVNRVMRDTVFSDSIYYDVDPEDLTVEIKQRCDESVAKQPRRLPPVRGVCKGGKPHGPFVVSLHGTVCTACGRVGAQQYKLNFTEKVVAQSKLANVSTASNTELPPGAMRCLARTTDPARSMTRGDFVWWTQRAYSVPIEHQPTKYRSHYVPADLREWFVFLYDFVKDYRVDRSSRVERIAKSWAYAIWVYGYLAWITVRRAHVEVDRKATQFEELVHADTTGTCLVHRPLQKMYRYLELQYREDQISYYRIKGCKYRFYPPEFKSPQFASDLSTSKKYADARVKSLYDLTTSSLLQTQDRVRARFWDNRYQLCIDNVQRRIRVRAAPHADECYLHVAVPKDVPIHFECLAHTCHRFKVMPWNDPCLLAKYSKAAHYLVHLAPFHGVKVVSKLTYSMGVSRRDSTTIALRHLGPVMKRQSITVQGGVPIIIRPAVLTLHLVDRAWVYAAEPPS